MNADPLIGDLDSYDQIGCELVADVLRAGFEARVRVMGTSMLPALWPGDTLVIRNRAAAPSVGDVVLFMRDRRLFAHRVMRITDSELFTRGDALTQRDPPLRTFEVLGVVVGIIRDGSDPIAPRAPSIRQRIAAMAIRRSDIVYRMVLRWRRIGRHSDARATELPTLRTDDDPAFHWRNGRRETSISSQCGRKPRWRKGAGNGDVQY